MKFTHELRSFLRFLAVLIAATVLCVTGAVEVSEENIWLVVTVILALASTDGGISVWNKKRGKSTDFGLLQGESGSRELEDGSVIHWRRTP